MSFQASEETSLHEVLQPSSTHTTPSVVSQEAYEHEQLLRFFIGLRLLGEKRQQRFLAYMATLLKEAPSGKEGE
jgi:hypothetical protein